MTDAKGRRRVLFVEDEPALRLSYERHFNPRYDLFFASTGAEALALLEEHPPDVAVLDMRLPDTDGVDLLRRIRRQRQQLRARRPRGREGVDDGCRSSSRPPT